MGRLEFLKNDSGCSQSCNNVIISSVSVRLLERCRRARCSQHVPPIPPCMYICFFSCFRALSTMAMAKFFGDYDWKFLCMPPNPVSRQRTWYMCVAVPPAKSCTCAPVIVQHGLTRIYQTKTSSLQRQAGFFVFFLFGPEKSPWFCFPPLFYDAEVPSCLCMSCVSVYPLLLVRPSPRGQPRQTTL